MSTLRIYNTTKVPLIFNEDDVLSKSKFLTPVAQKCTVIAVDEDVIDEFYPPEKRKSLDEECLREILKSYRNIEELEDMIENCEKDFEISSKFVAVGLFMCKPNYDKVEKLEEILNKNKIKYNSRDIWENVILICPERINGWANKLNVSQKIANLKVLFHEYAHAYLCNDRNNYLGTWYEKVVEEGLANYIVIEIFKNSRYKSHINKLILSQPVEYKTCYAYLHDNVLKILPPNFFYKHFERIKFLLRRYSMVLFPFLSVYHVHGEILSLWKNRYLFEPEEDFDELIKLIAISSLKEII